VITHLLYLHGFRSSPSSTKSRRMARWVAEHRPDLVWAAPQLPPSPAQAMREIEVLTAGWPRATTGVIGSSLGGFYATVFAQRRGCRGVVINPAVDPARDLADHIGRQTMYHDPAEAFFFLPEYVDELRAMAPGALAHPERLLAIVATGDEVLDWREMAARYAGGPCRIVEGSDHGLTDFDDHLPALVQHLGL
jgi:predicted esterase YcpF (UPF0227 family)